MAEFGIWVENFNSPLLIEDPGLSGAAADEFHKIVQRFY